MEILITIYKPLQTVKLIQIYAPSQTDESTISFLIDVDGVYATFLLKDCGQWKRKGSNGRYSRKTIKIIENAIMLYYISGRV